MAFRIEGTPVNLQINAGDGWHSLVAIDAVAGMLDKAEAFRREHGSCGVSVHILFDEQLPGWRAAVAASNTGRTVRVREGAEGEGIEVRIEASMYPTLKPGSVVQTGLILKLPEVAGPA